MEKEKHFRFFTGEEKTATLSTDTILIELECLGLSLSDSRAQVYDSEADMVGVILTKEISFTQCGCQRGSGARRSHQVIKFGNTFLYVNYK
jgi:hypothetical protein